MRFKLDWASLIVGSKFTVFALCFTLYLRAIFQVQAPGGVYLEGRFNGGIFALPVWGAFIWRGLYMDGLIFGILRYLFPGYREKSRATRKKTWGEMQGKKGELSFAPPFAALPLARAFCRTSLRSPLHTESLRNNNLGPVPERPISINPGLKSCSVFVFYIPMHCLG